MNSSNQGHEAEQSQVLLNGLLATMSAAAALQYVRDIYARMEYLHGTLLTEAGNTVNPGNLEAKNNSSPEMKAAGQKLEASYATLMTAIGQMRECIDPVVGARSRHATERLKRLITRARKLVMNVRECLLEIERVGNK